MNEGEYGIVANVARTDRVFRTGAKCWLVRGTGGAGWDRFVWYGLSRGGRCVRKWTATRRFTNFRAAWIPPTLQSDCPLYMQGSRQEMERRAELLNGFIGDA